MVDKWKYKVFTDKVSYVPIAGTIREVLEDSVEIAKQEDKPVEVLINDILMNVNKDSDVSKLLSSYHTRLEQKFQYLQHSMKAHKKENVK